MLYPVIIVMNGRQARHLSPLWFQITLRYILSRLQEMMFHPMYMIVARPRTIFLSAQY
jgi:hypothetical protein